MRCMVFVTALLAGATAALADSAFYDDPRPETLAEDACFRSEDGHLRVLGCRQLMELRTPDAALYVARSQGWAMLGDTERALADMEQAMALAREEDKVAVYRPFYAEALVATGANEQALAVVMEEAHAMEDEWLVIIAAEIHVAAGRFEEADRILSYYTQGYEPGMVTWYRLGAVACLRGDADRAISHMSDLFWDAPDLAVKIVAAMRDNGHAPEVPLYGDARMILRQIPSVEAWETALRPWVDAGCPGHML